MILPRGTARGAAVIAAAPSLAGCGILSGEGSEAGRGGERGDPGHGGSGWAHDAQSSRYYRTDQLLQETDLVEPHFPELAVQPSSLLTEGQFSEPEVGVVCAGGDQLIAAAREM